MDASSLIKQLEKLIEDHDDFPVTIVAGTYEYSVSDVFHASPGPIPSIQEYQKQSPPERFVLEAKNDIADSI